MNNPPRILDFDDVIELCGSVATSRGQALKNGGHVKDLDWVDDGQVLYAAVQDTEGEPWQQRITIAAHRFDGECSCPAHHNCKHVAAALLSWVEQQKAPASADDQALKKVNRWLSKLVENGRRTSPTLEHHELGEPLLFYQLDAQALTQHKSGITLQILQSRLLKRGGYGREAAYRYNGHYHHPDWVLASDRDILELAVGRQADFTYRTLTIDGDIGHLLMGKLLSTGRCWWGTERDKPLERGESRALTFNWQARADSPQELELDISLEGIDTWQLVPADPAWYIAPELGVAGPLENAPPTAILAQLVEAPPLPAAHAQTVSNYLASRLPDARLPLPVEPDFVRIEELPRPVLVLQSRDDSADIRHFYASIRFRYADYLLPYDGSDSDATLEGKTADGRPVVLKRDLATENRFVVEFGKRFLDFESALKSDGDFFSRADRIPRAKEVQNIAHAWRSLLEARAELEASGWRVDVREPFDLSFRSVTTVEATVSETTSSWFDMRVKLSHGEETFDLLPLVVEWLQTDSREQSILLQADNGEWLEVSPEVFAPVAETLLELYDERPSRSDLGGGESDDEAEDDTVLRLPRERALSLEAMDARWDQNGVSVGWHDAGNVFSLAERLRNFEGLEHPELPVFLRATCRDYQLDGIAWMSFLAEFGFNGILADDMGLGKTLQTLAHILHEREIGRLTRPVLVVAPTSLLGNWQREAARFVPTLSTLVWHGTERRSQTHALENTDIVITSYALATRDQTLMSQQNFGLLVLDEAQAIKNPSAKVTQAVKALEVQRRLCLTGTPLENHLGELWSQFDFLMPGFLGSRKHFNRYYRTPIETHGSTERQERLGELIRPFLLRRRKEQVATELPPKTEIIREVTLDAEQARLYESIRVSMEHRVRALLAERGLARSHIEMLDALLKLRQTCCHPALVKLDSARGVKTSAKTELVMEMLEELISEGKKILLFSQFTEMLGLLERELAKRDIPWVKLTGRTRKRDEVIDSFQHGDVPLFLISLKAGGTGLNLTAADTVIHYDPWWNPAVENQASDRAHRIGQDKPVFIYKLVASDTVEEKIMAMQKHKQLLADQTVNRGEASTLKGLSSEDVLQLFAPMDSDNQSAA